MLTERLGFANRRRARRRLVFLLSLNSTTYRVG